MAGGSGPGAVPSTISRIISRTCHQKVISGLITLKKHSISITDIMSMITIGLDENKKYSRSQKLLESNASLYDVFRSGNETFSESNASKLKHDEYFQGESSRRLHK